MAVKTMLEGKIISPSLATVKESFCCVFVIADIINCILHCALWIRRSIMPTFNFELRDFGAALAKEEMSSSDKRREVAEHLEGEGTFEKEGGLAFEPLDFPSRYPLVFWGYAV